MAVGAADRKFAQHIETLAKRLESGSLIGYSPSAIISDDVMIGRAGIEAQTRLISDAHLNQKSPAGRHAIALLDLAVSFLLAVLMARFPTPSLLSAPRIAI